MSYTEEGNDDHSLNVDGFSSSFGRGIGGRPSFNPFTSSIDENTRLRCELERVTRQMEILLAHEERDRGVERVQTRHQLKQVQTFSGKDSRISVNDWVRDVDYLVRTSRLEHDSRGALDLVERYVTGQAAKVFRGEVNKGKEYDEVLKRMQVMFGGIEYRGRDPLQVFYCRSQRETETPSEYAIELSELLGIAEKEGNNGRKYPARDKMLRDVLMGGLREDRVVLQLRPLVAMEISFEQIQDELLKLEYDRKQHGFDKKSDTPLQKVTSSPQPSVGGRAHRPPMVEDPVLKAIREMRIEFKEDLSKIQAQFETQAKEIRDLREKAVGQAPKPIPWQPRRDSPWDRRVCHTCGKTGHISYQCYGVASEGMGGGRWNTAEQPRTNETQRNVQKPKENQGERMPVAQGESLNPHSL